MDDHELGVARVAEPFGEGTVLRMDTRDETLPVTNGIWTPDDDTLPLLGDQRMSRPPIKLMLSLVGMCNLRCFHCLGTSDESVTLGAAGSVALIALDSLLFNGHVRINYRIVPFKVLTDVLIYGTLATSARKRLATSPSTTR